MPEFDITHWLESIGLAQYAAAFAEQDITLETLQHLTGDDLKELGVTSLGHRKTILVEIEKLKGGTPAPSAPETPVVAAETPAPAEPKPNPAPVASPAKRAPVPTRAAVAAPAVPVTSPEAPPAKSRRGFWVKVAASKFLVVSILAHLFFGMGATYYIVQSITTKRKLTFQEGPPASNRSKRALEHKVSMAQKKKTGGAPPQAKRIVSTGLAKVSLPDMPSLPTTSAVPGMVSGMGGVGFGAGMGFGNGMGSGMGGGGGGGMGISFFGLRTSGKHIAFLLDYSGSMDGQFRKTMERELEVALKKLPSGAQVLLIPWAGPAWLYNQTAPQIMSKWKKADPNDPAGYDNFILTGKLDPPAWVGINPASVEEIMKGIHAQVAAPGGTDWRQPFRYVMQATPPPDVIFFMTDGQIPPKTAGRALTAIDGALKKGMHVPQVNCLWIENTKEKSDDLKVIAKKYGGEFRAVTAAGAK